MIDATTSLAFSIFSNKGVYALLLGSGISSSAGILTGWGITSDLMMKLSIMQCESVDEAKLVDWYRDKYKREPDYSYILEKLAKTEIERQNLLRGYFEPTKEEKEEGIKAPTKAHNAIARLIAIGYIKLVVTTNFDRLLEYALEKLGFTTYRVLSTAEEMQGGIPLRHSGATILKIHGDYRSHKLKNTEEELSEYEPAINKMLDQVFDEYGLIVCGWSADYDHALRKAIKRSPNRRYSTYWTYLSVPKGQAPKLIKHRDATKIKISGADRFFEELTEKILSLEEDARAAHPMSERIAIATVKRYLPDPLAQIKLHELITSETDHVVNEIQRAEFTACDTLRGELNGVHPYSDEERIPKYEKICSRLLKLLCVISRWGDERQADLIADTLQRISLAKPENYNPRRVILVNLQLYPVLLLFYAVGITRLAARKYDLFAKFTSFTYIDDENKEMPFIASMKPDKVLKSVRLPRSAPCLTSYIFDTLREPLREFISDDKMYRNYTERFEYYKWITTFFEAGRNNELELAAESGCPWRFFANIRYENMMQRFEPLSDTIKREIERHGIHWGPLRDGLCDGDMNKMIEIIDLIAKEEKEYMKKR